MRDHEGEVHLARVGNIRRRTREEVGANDGLHLYEPINQPPAHFELGIEIDPPWMGNDEHDRPKTS